MGVERQQVNQVNQLINVEAINDNNYQVEISRSIRSESSGSKQFIRSISWNIYRRYL